MSPALTPVALLLLAIGVDLALGDPPNRWHPVAWIGRALDTSQRRLCRGGPLRLRLGGGAALLGVTAVVGLAAWGLSALSARLGGTGLVIEALALKSTLSLRGLVVAARRVARHLERGDLGAARRSVGRDLVSRPAGALGEGQVASAAIESVAENLTDGLVAPVCFFLAFGLAGAAVYRVVNTADAMFGYRDGVLEHFGKVAARLDDLLNFLPARFAAAVLVVGAALAGADARGAVRVGLRDRRLTASPNAGWTMAVMAGALGVSLEKPGAYRLGDGHAPRAGDIQASVKIMVIAWGVTLAVLIALMIAFSTLQPGVRAQTLSLSVSWLAWLAHPDHAVPDDQGLKLGLAHPFSPGGPAGSTR